MNAVWSEAESAFVYLPNNKQNDTVTEEQAMNVFDENYMTGGADGAAGDHATITGIYDCLLYTSPSPRDGLLSRMPSSA